MSDINKPAGGISIEEFAATVERMQKFDVQHYAQEFFLNRESLVMAYMAQTGLRPSEIILCEQVDGTTRRAWCERKTRRMRRS